MKTSTGTRTQLIPCDNYLSCMNRALRSQDDFGKSVVPNRVYEKPTVSDLGVSA